MRSDERGAKQEIKTLKAMHSVGFGMWVRRAAMAGALVAGLGLMTRSAAARQDGGGDSCVVDPMNLSAVICTIGGGSSPSTFLGAFASDNNGKGGWTEFYSDDDGEYWVEHHADGGTSVGWEDALGGGNYMNGPKFSTNQEGTYNKKKRPALKGAMTKGPLRTYAAAKAQAAQKTGTLAAMAPKASTVSPSTFGTFANLSMYGSGKCSATLIVKKDGAVVSTTGIVPLTLPGQKVVSLPSVPGQYTIEAVGKNGCLGQSQKTSVAVQVAPRRS